MLCDRQVAASFNLQDCLAMAKSYNLTMAILTHNNNSSHIIVWNPLGVDAYNTVVQSMGLTEHDRMSQRLIREWYADASNENLFVARRRACCPGCMLTMGEPSERGFDGGTDHQ